jgi:hypothetical protein
MPAQWLVLLGEVALLYVNICHLSKQCPMDAAAYAEAAAFDHFHILNWLYEHECPMDSRACTAAVHKRRLDVLCWLYEHGCQGDVKTCEQQKLRTS